MQQCETCAIPAPAAWSDGVLSEMGDFVDDGGGEGEVEGEEVWGDGGGEVGIDIVVAVVL